jgi:hypothetical protein
MGRRAKSSGVALDCDDAAIVKGMLARGDRQHDIAAWFGVNGGRIAEVASGATFEHVGAATADDLPPPGPYLSGRQSQQLMEKLINTKASLVHG